MLNNKQSRLKEKLKKDKDKLPDIWKVLEKRKKKGLWDGEIEVIETTSQSLIKGAHYYVIDDPKQASIRCISCSVPHGGILEAHMLHRYNVKDGVLYFDGEPANQTPDGFKQ
jgi:hypothetical protein